jgi:mannan endo-1,4-beta-mannosidase
MFVAYDDNASSGHGLIWYKNVSFSSGTFMSDAPVILANSQQTFQVVSDTGGNIYSANMNGTITKFMPNDGVYSSANQVTVRFFSNGSYVLGGLMIDNTSNTLWTTSYTLNTLAVCRLSDFPSSSSYVTTSTPATFIKPVTVSANYIQAPEGIVRDESGNVWISNNNNNYIVRINSTPVSTILSEVNAANYTEKSLTGGTDANTWAVSASGQQLGGMVYDNLYSKKIFVNNQSNGGNTFQYEFLPTNGTPTFAVTAFAQIFPGNGQSAIIPCALLSTPSNPTASGTTINSGQTANLTATNCAADQTYLWKQGGTQVATTASFTTPALTNNTIYTVYCIRGGTCHSSGVSVTVNINGGGGISQNVTISVVTPTTTGSTRTDSRTFRFHLPSSNPDCNLPVLFAFHGDGGTGAGMETMTGFSTLADANNFIAVYPDKLSGQSYFSYRIDQPAYLNGQVDSTFMLAVINYLHINYGINKNRVYATGISSGANITYFASAKLFNAFAAFAPVAGFPQDYSSTDVWQSIINNGNTPKVPLMHVHGTADVTSGTQFTGTNLPNPYPSSPPSLTNQWIWPMFPLSNKGCSNAPGNFTGAYFTAGNTTVDKLTFCTGGGSNKELSMMIIRGMGHTWPTTVQTGGINGSLAIWNFLKDYQLNLFSNPAPTVSPSSITINAGQSTTLTASCTSGYGVKWNTEATTTAISVSPLATTTYMAYCTYGINCQSAGTSSTVTVNNGGGIISPIISGNPLTICENDGSNLKATGCSTGVVIWSNGQTGTSIYVYPTVTTAYTAVCTISPNSSNPSNEVTITVNPNPTVNLTSTLPIENNMGNDNIYARTGQIVTLNVTNCSGTVYWSYGASNATTNSITLTIDDSGDYNMLYIEVSCTRPSSCQSSRYLVLLKQFATNDTFTTNVNTPVTGNVKDNDAEASLPFPYEVMGVQHGTVVWQISMGRPTGVLTYTPDNGFMGVDSLVYHLTDDLTFSKSATVKFIVGNPCIEELIVSGNDYPSNTISGISTLSAVNSVKTVVNAVASNDPLYIRTSIASTASITFQAGKSITLNPGFQTNEGAVFTTKMGACTSGTGFPFLTVQGIKIKNKCGTDFLIRGVNFGGYWQYDINNRMNTLNRIKEIKKSGANTVRLPWSSDTEYSRDYKVLDTLIKHIVANKMIVMVEFHDLTCANLTPANIQIATNYWTSANVLAVLKKYENYLILNIANEVGSDWQGNTPAVVQKMIDAYTPSIIALRNAGLKCPITIDATDCGQNIEALVSAAPTLLANDPDHNLIFSAHLYWNNDNYTTRLTNAAINAVTAGICLVVGEFSVSQDCPLDATPNDYVAIMQVCNQKGIGYLAWEWGGSRQYGGSGNLCPDDSRGVGYSRLTMTGLSGLYADRAGWGLTVVNDIQATSIESCQFNP